MTNASRHHVRLTVEYDGAPFHGWSRQPGLATVEGELRRALAALHVDVHAMRCAGRTDTGVHALAQVVSLDCTTAIPAQRLGDALNSVLGSAIAVRGSQACPPAFDARSDARSRAYEYRVLARRSPSPLRADRVLHHPRPLDRALLDRCAAAIVGQHDFTAFTPTQTDHVFFHRTVLASRWEARDDELVYCIRANAFLRHMVRILVGTMLAVGRGDYAADRFGQLLAGATRSDAHHTAPAHALVLVDVEYPGDPDAPQPDGRPEEVGARPER